jgi:SulP family sulfate permease
LKLPHDRRSVLSGLRFDLQELSGAFGDIGVLVPIAAALIVTNGFNPTSLFLVFGVAYIGSALYFRLPMPVQPLKATAAVAIAQGLHADVVAAGGLIMGVLLLLLAATNLIRPVASFFSQPVIRGIQVAVGLLLLQAGLRLALGSTIVRGGEELRVAAAGLAIPVAAVVTVALIPVLLVALFRPRVPVVLAVLPAAIALGVVASPGAPLAGLSLGPEPPDINVPSVSMLATALVLLVLPQLPLTLGNAVIASADTAHGYFGERAERVTHRSILVSKGCANLFAGVLGGMPVCHGSGGLTAH